MEQLHDQNTTLARCAWSIKPVVGAEPAIPGFTIESSIAVTDCGSSSARKNTLTMDMEIAALWALRVHVWDLSGTLPLPYKQHGMLWTIWTGIQDKHLQIVASRNEHFTPRSLMFRTAARS